MSLLNIWGNTETKKSENVLPNFNSKAYEWPDDDINYLLRNYKHKEYANMAEELGVTVNIINNKLRSMREKGLIDYGRLDLWSDKEVEFIISNYGHLIGNEIAKYLKRTVGSVRNKISGLRRDGVIIAVKKLGKKPRGWWKCKVGNINKK